MATKTNKKKLSTGGKLLIFAGVAGAGYLTYEYFLKDLFKKDEGTPAPGAAPEINALPFTPPSAQINQIVAAVDQVQPNVEELNNNKKLSQGSKGTEVERVQTNFNDIIDKMRKVNALPFSGAGLVNNMFGSGKISVERIKQIANLQQLTVDGNFGAKTAAVGSVIMGKNTFSLEEVRAKKAQLFNAIGL